MYSSYIYEMFHSSRLCSCRLHNILLAERLFGVHLNSDKLTIRYRFYTSVIFMTCCISIILENVGCLRSLIFFAVMGGIYSYQLSSPMYTLRLSYVLHPCLSRFSPEEKARHTPFDHMPFGYGPRSCIAMRLALLEVKLAAALVLKNFSVMRTERTEVCYRNICYPLYLNRRSRRLFLKMSNDLQKRIRCH